MNFTSDFFSKNIPAWEKYLAQFKDRPVHALELGSLEGRASTWLLENILTHPESRLECVDLKVLNALHENLKPFGKKVEILEMDATEYAGTTTDKYDIIYIDAHHIAKDVIMQAGLLWPQLAKGGVMIFDDYGHKVWTVKPAVDFFLRYWEGEGITVLHRGWQVIIQRN